MASITTNKKTGRRRVEFLNLDSERKAIGLGQMPLKRAEAVRDRVQTILDCRRLGIAFDPDTAAWLAKISSELADALSKGGVIPPRAKSEGPAAATLAGFVDGYIKMRTDVKPNTVRIWKQTRGLLVKFFGESKRLADITALNAKAWRLGLIEQGFAEATVRKHTGFAKGFFAAAIDGKLIGENPFHKLNSSSIGNEARQRFVTPQEIAKVIDAAPSAAWRAIIVLSRFGGLRTPSETLGMRWEDILWDQARMRVRSPKTERVGKPERMVPLFPEVREALEELFELAQPGAELLFEQPNAESNVRTQMARIIRRAGLVPWPRVFHNLRSSRQTELVEQFPSHVVASWLGNTEAVANRHYLQTTDAHFAQAVAGEACVKTCVNKSEIGGNRRKSQNRESQKTAENTDPCDDFEAADSEKAAVDGNRTHLASLQTTRRV